MKISSIMSDEIHLVESTDTLRDAALLMQREDIGSVPVREAGKLVGMVTDRDIVIRGIAEDLPAETEVREVMSSGLKVCFDDETVDDVAAQMATLGVRRLPVVNRDHKLVGFISLSNIASAHDASASAALLGGTAQPH